MEINFSSKIKELFFVFIGIILIFIQFYFWFKKPELQLSDSFPFFMAIFLIVISLSNRLVKITLNKENGSLILVSGIPMLRRITTKEFDIKTLKIIEYKKFTNVCKLTNSQSEISFRLNRKAKKLVEYLLLFRPEVLLKGNLK